MFFYCISSFLWIRNSCRKFIIPISKIKKIKITLVLGAGLEKDGKPADILMDRVVPAVDLYKARKTELLVLSGSDMSQGFDETKAMRKATVSLGIPETAISIDPQGYSTFDSCLNLMNHFSPSEIIVITQIFHLPRSIFLLRALGIQAYGIPARIYHFSFYKKAYWYLREVFALQFNTLKLLKYFLK
jgi:SanA protein